MSEENKIVEEVVEEEISETTTEEMVENTEVAKNAPVEEKKKSSADKPGAFNVIVKILISLVYLVTTGYLVYLLAASLEEGGLAPLAFLAMLIYSIPVYLLNIVLSVIGIIKASVDKKKGKRSKFFGKYYIASIIVAVVTYLILWLALPISQLFI